jgi:RNase P subunit RPR2
MPTTTDPFHWTKRVARKDIQRLYDSDASGMLDVELLEQVLFAMQARVADMLEVRQAQTFGRVTCRGCGASVPQPFRMGSRGKVSPLHCEQCGWQVTCGEYYDSYTGERMLPGSVPEIFEQFMQRLPSARTPQQKMLLVDWLIHEFHVNQGIPGRPVGENVIQGSAEQVADLVASLAWGAGSTTGLHSPITWIEEFNNPVRLFRRGHSRAETQQIARELGVQGISRMSDDQLVLEIYRLAPERFGEAGAGRAKAVKRT